MNSISVVELLDKKQLTLKNIDNSYVPKNLVDTINVEELIFNCNVQNLKDSIEKLKEILNRNKYLVPYALKVMEYASSKRQRSIEQLSRLFIEVSKEFNTSIELTDVDFGTVLKEDGYESNVFHEEKSKAEVVQIESKNIVMHAIIWDKLEEFKQVSSQHNMDFEKEFIELTLLDLSAKYGSSQIFKHLISTGHRATKNTCVCAVEGGNKEIIEFLAQKRYSFDNCLTKAIEFHRNDIASWLLEKYTCEICSISKCIKFMDISAAIFFAENGFNVNKKLSFTSVLHFS